MVSFWLLKVLKACSELIHLRTHNPSVEGSSPSRPTRFSRIRARFAAPGVSSGVPRPFSPFRSFPAVSGEYRKCWCHFGVIFGGAR